MLHRILSNISPINANFTVADIIKSWNQLYKRGFRRTGTTENTDRAAFFNVQRYITQNEFLCLLPVLEIHMIKRDIPMLHRRCCLWQITDIHLLVQHLKNTLTAGNGSCQHQKDIADHHQRIQNLQYIAQKSGQLSHLHRTGKNHIPAEPDDTDNRGIHNQLKQRQIPYRGAKCAFTC